MSLKTSLFIICLALITCSGASSAQGEREYVDKTNGFKIVLAGKWRPLSYTDAVGRQRTEFVWENRSRGLLRIARQNLAGRSLADIVRNEVEGLKLSYACMFTGQEAFSGGSLSGTRVSLYYFEGSRRMTGVYYLLEDKDAVWFLRFTGEIGSPALAREVTDKVARSFCSVCAL
ncbi:MAG TPA: hypothetical protein VLM38_17310 [Blastocatellia bacterium]|nr:hypothetical protein [Blastocatellia bacterium]